MKKFNFDKILLCFGIFFVSIFGIGMTDSFALTESEFDSYTNKYILNLHYESWGGSPYLHTYDIKIGSSVPFYLSDSYVNVSDNSNLYFYDSNGNKINVDVLTKHFQHYGGDSVGAPDEFNYSSYNGNYYEMYNIYPSINSTEHYLPTFDKLIKSSNFDLKTYQGNMVFQNNPLKEVKQVGEAVKNQTKTILPIAIFLMGCLILVQILRRVLTRFSVS